MSCDLNDDVDRLFACFKCGVSTPESAVKERRLTTERSKKGSLRGEASQVMMPSSSKQRQQDSAQKEKFGAYMSLAANLKSGKQISPIVFYGSPHGAPIKRPSRLLRLLHEIHVDLKEENDFISRKEVWATFPRQGEAMEFLKEQHAQARLFSYQDHLTGQRRFLVSTYSEFWTRYRVMDPKIRHHYEVIQEGLPCHIYFDLEFSKKVNIDKDVDEMMDILMSVTFNVLFDKYSIEGNKEWIIELDSSTKEKFSRHVIIRIPNIAFKDNSHVGAFVSEVCSRITSQRGNDTKLDKLYIRKDESSPDFHLFLDSAVYSRNRCFRMAFSSKAGKNTFLFPTQRFKWKNMMHNEQDVFMESLICRMDSDCNKLLICQMDTDCKKTLCFDFEVQQQNLDVPRYSTLSAYSRDFASTRTSGKSPFPALDAFVEYIASSGNVLGQIRSWYWFSEHGLIVYSMTRNRYCERIGREHKSNHVMYVADLHRAVYYQKCYDPDCRGYRSPLRPLPHEVIPDSKSLFNSNSSPTNYREELASNFNLDLNGICIENHLTDDDKLVADSCKKEKNWWQEAVTYADGIENMTNAPEFELLDEENDEDCSWWMDVEMLVSQVEQQLG